MAERRIEERTADGVCITIEPDPSLDVTTCACCRVLPCICTDSARQRAMQEFERQGLGQAVRRKLEAAKKAPGLSDEVAEVAAAAPRWAIREVLRRIWRRS